MKIFGRDQFSRKLFCDHKKILSKIFVGTRFPGNDFATKKKFSTKKFRMKIFGRDPFSRKLFCDHKKFLTKRFLLKILGRNLF